MMIRYLVLMVLVIGCNEAKEEENYPVTESQVLNNLVHSAPIQYINLDSVRTIKIVLSEDVIFYSGNLTSDSFIGWMTRTIATENAYYVYESSDKKIVKINFDGSIEKTVAANGKGPGEVLRVTSMTKNSSNIFVADQANARINVYDHNFNLEKTQPSFLVRNISVNEEYMIYNKLDYQGIRTSGMVTIAKLSSPQDSITKIMPKIVPDGFQPLVYNSLSFDINNKNEIAASYNFLPWVSLFDSSFLLERTLILESSDFEKRDLLKLKIHPPNPDNKDGVGGASIAYRFEYLDNGDLYIIDKLGIIHLRRKKDRSYEAAALYVLDYPESERKTSINDFDFLKDGTMVASNWHYLFRLKLIK